MGLSDILIYDGTTPISLIIWAFYIGIAIAVLASYFIKIRHGKLIKSLIDSNANTPETAKTLDELGKNNFFTRIALKNHAYYKDALVAITEDGRFYTNYQYSDEPPKLKQLKALARTKSKKSKNSENEIAAVEEQATKQISTEQKKPYKRERVKFNPATTRFYIPNEVQSKVNIIYNEKKTNIWFLILALIGCAIFTYLAIPIIEQILQTIDDITKGGTSI